MIPTRLGICTAIEDRSPIEQVVPTWRALDTSLPSGPVEVVVIAAAQDAGPATRRRFAELLAPWRVACLDIPDLPEWVPNLSRSDAPWDLGTELVRSHKRAALRAAVQRAGLRMDVDWFLWLDSDNDIRPDGWHCLLETLTSTKGRLAPRVACGLYAERRIGDPLAARWGKGRKGVPHLHLFPNSVTACGYMGFGCVLTSREVMVVPDLDFLQTYTSWRDARRGRLELDPDKSSPDIWGEDTLWLYAAEMYYGVPLYCDTRVLSNHWRDPVSYWSIVPQPDGMLNGELVMTDGRRFRRGDPDIPPVVERTAESAAMQEAAG